MGAYRELLATPGVWRLTLAVLLSRLSVSMLSLAMLVAATQLHGYANAGLLMLAYALTNAAVGPVRGRLADRYSPRRVMFSLLAVHVVAFVVLLLAFAAEASMSLLVPAGVLLGLSVPPTGPVVRGLWPTVVPAERLATAYAFDSGLNTATFVAGPMVAGGLLLVLPVHLVVAVTGLLKVTGDVLVTVSPIVRDAVRAAQVSSDASVGWSARVFGPLVHGRVRLLLALILLDTVTFGCLEVAAVASASGQGSAGLLTSAFALGGAISGIGYGARVWPGSPRAQLILLGAVGTVVLAAGSVSAELVAGMVLVGIVFVLFGLANGPVETVKQVLIGEISPTHQRIEVFSWVFSVMWLGFGLGTTVAGQLAESGEAAPTLLVATAAQLVAVLVTVAAVAGLRRPHPVNT